MGPAVSQESTRAVDVYSTCISHNHTGLLVKNDPNAWYKAISLLIENSRLRTQIQEQAFEFVRQNYSQQRFTELWQQQIRQVLNLPVRKKLSYKRKLSFKGLGS